MHIIIFALIHIKEYNKSWDFYKGLSVRSNRVINEKGHSMG